MPESNFTKILLQSYVITNCERRLFLELGRNKPQLWFDPMRKVPDKPPERLMFQRKYLTEKGKEYEQMVYKHLKKLDNVHFRESDKGNVSESTLNLDILNSCYNTLKREPKKTQILLEHQYSIPQSFISNIFVTKSANKVIPVDYSDQRPDIILLGNDLNNYLDSGEIFEITHNGKIRKVPVVELNTRIGITIFDIKYVQDERVGKKHFLEIFYYLKTLAVQIKEFNLQKKYYIRANLNGIFPFRDDKELSSIKSVEDLFELKLVNMISWKEADRIFLRVIEIIRSLWGVSPCPIEQIELNFHQGCGYCRYIEDCKMTLGMRDGGDPRDFSSQVLPFTSQSIAKQLIEEYNLNTIGDVLDNIEHITIGSIPKPLYSELPTLKMKAEALIYQRAVYPQLGQTQSYAIPRYSPIAISFDVEYDQNNDKIFGIGIYVKMFIHSKQAYHTVFDNWWNVWKKALENDDTIEKIQEELKQNLIREVPPEVIKQFKKILLKLKKVKILLKEENKNFGTRIDYWYLGVNKNDTPASEGELIKNAIRRLDLILTMCNILEDYAVIDGIGGVYYGPDTSLFYWSRSQLDQFQDMMERHLTDILDNQKVRNAYESILMYLSPSETEVSHPFQHKKLFDVQAFVDSFIGLPEIINYTWHGIAHQLFNYQTNPLYWVPHFNFLDLTNWLKYLSKTDQNEKKVIGKGIKRQIYIKLYYIDRIRQYFQKEARPSLSENSNVIGRSEYKNAMLPYYYHDIAHVWYLFSKLNSALQQQDDEYYRTMFPQFSIGKLFAAEVSNLEIHNSSGKTNYYTFETLGLSSNMKIKEGDGVLLIPNYKRGLRIDNWVFKWVVYLDSIVWDSSINGNLISTKPNYSDVFEQCQEEGKNPDMVEWYLYPLSSDAWSKKLYNSNNNGLLEREGFGRSWLGFRLAYLWKIRTDPTLMWPSRWKFDSPVIYLFAPRLLNHFTNKHQDQLLTQITPNPDLSQQEAILNSLKQVISGILGPPGTGKSQTIAALIDEFIIRKTREGKHFRILVTSFSYAALRVVIDKIRTGKINSSKQTNSSQTQMLFLRSETQDPIEPKKNCRNVDDLLRKGKSWKLNDQTHIVTENKLLEESVGESFILFANAHQLYYLHERVREDFAFDLICVDEASQMPTDYFMSCLQYIHKHPIAIKKPQGIEITPDTEVKEKNKVDVLQINEESITVRIDELTKVVIVGDHNQLPPVRVKNPPKNLELILDSLFYYYIKGHNISTKQLKTNYRSHQDIVAFTSLLGLYKDLKANKTNANATLKGNLDRIKHSWVREVLTPDRIMCSLIHHRKFEIGISEFEADLVTSLVSGFYAMSAPQNIKEEKIFWKEKIGVVAPHNAQGRTIIRRIFENFRTKTHLPQIQLMEYLKQTVYSVEKFQGSDRDLIISSIGLSDIDKISAEEEFIFDLNRFNVLTSRAKHKIIFISSAEFLRYIPEDRKVLEHASKVYLFVEEFCNKKINLSLKNKQNKEEQIELRFKQ
ncbi:MAG: hypothetical protein KGD67_00745 [Candidatus Lokiarchaeota archaeon]|nr:hypothetical protein [Candidatus Lokiarchaeota archaeon]